MANLSLRHIYKVYPNGTKAVSDFNMEIKDKEFIVFVGPSGCGKSTTLRMIAGLEDITAGELLIDNKLVNDVEPKDRDIAMVFQNYALYPHMTVYDNMAFGLKLRHMPPAEIHEKILWAAKILGISEYLDRKPKAMSGGQRQRVALGRAILRNPKVFLLDEPLSNLDAKLRTQMRSEISKLHKELGTTFIYVTHDQVEAMTMGTRIVVMKLGRIQQIDTPKNLYNYPTNKFVAGFIGTPQMNFFDVNLNKVGDNVLINFKNCDDHLNVPFNDLLKVQPDYFNGDKDVTLGIRCEHISIDPNIIKNSSNVIKIKVSHFEELGSETLIYGDLNMNGNGYDENSTRIIVKVNEGYLNIKQGDIINAAIDINHLHLFDKNTEESIIPRLPKTNLFECAVKGSKLNFVGNELLLPPAIKLNDNNYNVLIPCDAIHLGNTLEATIVNIEDINGTTLTHLKINNRVFFAYFKDDYKIGDRIKIDFDFSMISFIKNNEIVIKPLDAFDEIKTGFTSLATLKSSKKIYKKFVNHMVDDTIFNINKKEDEALKGIYINPNVPKILKAEFKNKISLYKAEESFQLQKGELGKEGKDKIKTETKRLISEAKEEYANKLNEFINEKKRLDNLSDKEKETLNSKKADISAKYDAEINYFKEYLNVFNSVVSTHDKEMEALTKELKLEAYANYESIKEKGIKAQKLRLETDKENLEKAKYNPNYKFVRAEISDEEKAYSLAKDKVMFSNRQGFFMYNGYYFICPELIENKIIQALQDRSFNSIYRIEFAHNAYKISNNQNDLKVTVLDYFDYGYKKFIKCKTLNDILYVEVKSKVDLNKEIYLKVDISKAQIYENKFDIRLY